MFCSTSASAARIDHLLDMYPPKNLTQDRRSYKHLCGNLELVRSPFITHESWFSPRVESYYAISHVGTVTHRLITYDVVFLPGEYVSTFVWARPSPHQSSRRRTALNITRPSAKRGQVLVIRFSKTPGAHPGVHKGP